MDFSAIYKDVQSTFNYLIQFLMNFVNEISRHQLIIFALIVLIAVPALGSVFFMIRNIHSDVADVTENQITRYRSRIKEQQRKAKQAEIERLKLVKENERMNKHLRAHALAMEFFKNNPDRMSISIMGFKFFQDGFQNKNWSKSKKKPSSAPASEPSYDLSAFERKSIGLKYQSNKQQ